MEARYAFRKSQLLDECQIAPTIFEQVIPRLYTFMKPFVKTFHGQVADQHAKTSVCGLLSDVERKNIASIGHCSRDSAFDMDRPGDRFYTTGPHLFPQESQVCSDRGYTCQTPQRGLSTSRTSPHRNMCLRAGTSRTRPAHEATSSPRATKPDNGRCTTSAISPRVARWTCW